MQASRPRNMHTTAVIKLLCITLTVNLRPSQTTLRFCKPSGHPISPLVSVSFRSSPFFVPRPRASHTPVAIRNRNLKKSLTFQGNVLYYLFHFTVINKFKEVKP